MMSDKSTNHIFNIYTVHNIYISDFGLSHSTSLPCKRSPHYSVNVDCMCTHALHAPNMLWLSLGLCVKAYSVLFTTTKTMYVCIHGKAHKIVQLQCARKRRAESETEREREWQKNKYNNFNFLLNCTFMLSVRWVLCHKYNLSIALRVAKWRVHFA